jgi:zinc protease
MRNVKGVKDVSLEAGSEPLSVVTQVWTGDWNGSFTERYRLQSLATALEMQFTRSIREDSGGSYSVGVYPQLNEAPVNDYRFIIRFSCAPERVEELTGKIRGIVDEWRRTPPEDKYAHDVTASQQRSLSENLERNNWWIGQISFAVSTGIDPEDMLNRRALYDSLTPELLRDTAGRYLDDENYVQAVLYPGTGE